MKRLVVAVACVAAPMVALADAPRYTYVEGEYQSIDIDIDVGPTDVSVDGDGFGIGGSAAITERVFVRGAYSNLDVEGIDVDQYEIGIGGNVPTEENFHLVGEVGYTRAELNSADDDGFFVSGGFRWMASPQFELNAGLNYVDLDDSGDDTSLTVGGVFNVSPDLALEGNIELADDATAYAFGLRYYFPNTN